MARNLKSKEKAARSAHFADFPACWLCDFHAQKPNMAELHHIAGRGRGHEVRENYAALCRRHHTAIQSRIGAELICLVLKVLYDRDHYSPETICKLRGRAETCWTDGDVELALRIMIIMKGCC